MIGDLIDHFRILGLLGRGAMGVVYKAVDVNLDRTVAIKVMSAEARDDPDFVERFRQEARLQGALNHANVALLFDYFIHDGAPVAVMEFIDGESLEQLIARRGPVPAHEGIPLFKQALHGVAAAHRAGIIHRDLKPSNLMIARDGTVKVMDFGIAKRETATGATKASTSIGSPLYMAPEQILGRPIDCRTDVYALGITLYQLLSGQPPFNPRGKAEYVLLNAHVNDLPEPPTVHCRDIPQAIVEAVMRALAKDPDARFQSAEEFMRALPDVPTPETAAPQVDPSETVRLECAPFPREAPVATREPSSTVRPTGTLVFEYAASTRRDRHDSMAFDYSAATLRQASHPLPAARSAPASPAPQASRAAPPGLMQRLRARRPAIIGGLLVATLVLGALIRHAQRLHAPHRDALRPSSGTGITRAEASAPVQPGPSPAPPVPPPAIRPTLATAAPTRPNLSGTWRGEYIDASGRPLLRVLSLNISQVYDDGGVEGTLRYEAPAGDGECQLHPHGSTYSAGEQRLQLSPVGCSPHYPKELGVPLDFGGVNPHTNRLQDGRIEAPTGEVIRVELKRVDGA